MSAAREATDRVWLSPVLVAIAAAYALTAATTVQGGDNGEFCTLFATGGVAHPSGFPLYVLLLRAFSWIHSSSPAHGAALVTALIGVGTVTLLYGACRSWGARPWAAALASALYGLSPSAWDLASQAEVFTLNAAVAAGIVWAAAEEGPLRGTSRTAALGLLAGLGLSNNHTITLLAPLGICAAIRGLRESSRPWRALAVGIAMLALGLLPYVSLPLAAHGDISHRWVWGDVTTTDGILRHFLRTDYGATALTFGDVRPRPLAQIAAQATRVFEGLRFLPCVVAAAFLATRALGAARERPRARGVAWLVVALLATGPLLVARANVAASLEGDATVRRFDLLPSLLVSVLFALGVEAFGARVPKLARAATLGVAVVGGFVLGLPQIAAARRPMLENYLIDTLRTAPEGSVVLGGGDARTFGFLYATLGVRPDVVFVNPVMLHYPWYHRRMSDALGTELMRPSHGSLSTVALATEILALGRPLFLADDVAPAILRAFPSFPLGTLVRVLPVGVEPPSPAALERANTEVFAHYTIDPSVLDEHVAWSATVRDAYARPFRALASAFRAAGDEDAVSRNERRAKTLAPWIR